ncbi:MAG: cytochrome P460 family protein [Betaproteobacteria bacterium]
MNARSSTSSAKNFERTKSKLTLALASSLSSLCLFIPLACLSGSAVSEPDKSPPAFPQGYRSWVHVKSGVVDARAPHFARYGGVHHIYANAAALEGLRKGNYADGAVLVFDVLELKTIDGGSEEGARKLVDVMVRDASRFAATGGWGYEEFVAGDLSKPVLDEAARTSCFNCHNRMKKSGYVFSVLRDL